MWPSILRTPFAKLRSCTFSYHLDCVAKSQNPSIHDPRFDGFTIPSLDDIVGGDRDGLLLCFSIGLGSLAFSFLHLCGSKECPRALFPSGLGLSSTTPKFRTLQRSAELLGSRRTKSGR